MGNCLNKASKQHRQHGDMPPAPEEEGSLSLSEVRTMSQVLREEEEEEAEAAAAEGLKVKMVLTRGELEWLMAQLKTGQHRLEDVLHHVHAAKRADKQDHGGGAGWRPRLESILECPEAAADDDTLDLAAT
ncbi:hypothetical protein ACP70R_043146 [Stipagrostis hirtigluma subsp. patula]